METAYAAIENPAEYGIALPAVKGGYAAVRTTPLGANKATLEATEDIGIPAERLTAENIPGGTDLEGMAPEEFAARVLDDVVNPGDGPVIIVPKVALTPAEGPPPAADDDREGRAGDHPGLQGLSCRPRSPGWPATRSTTG